MSYPELLHDWNINRENERDAFAEIKSGFLQWEVKYKNLLNSGDECRWILPNKIQDSVSNIWRVDMESFFQLVTALLKWHEIPAGIYLTIVSPYLIQMPNKAAVEATSPSQSQSMVDFPTTFTIPSFPGGKIAHTEPRLSGQGQYCMIALQHYRDCTLSPLISKYFSEKKRNLKSNGYKMIGKYDSWYMTELILGQGGGR